MARYQNILETIGNTPLVKLNKLAPPGVNVYVKVESFNPMGSVKDRMAKAVIEDAERSGALKPGQTVIEATSGNTGIGLAMVCAQKGYPLVVTMAESFSVERRKLLRFLGAKVVLTPAAEKGSGMLAKAVELAETHGWFLCRQFENPANADVHSRTTAREILDDFGNERIDYFVTGFGTGGTLKGVARTLRQTLPLTQIVAAEPDNSPVLGSRIPQPRDAAGNPSGSHPHFRPHVMQGWSPDFISTLTEEAFRWPAPMRCGARASSRARKEYSSAPRAAPPWRPRSRWPGARRSARTSSACCPTPASVTCRHPCSKASAKR
jgi:cysteine synthase